jgi:hypothetical protein
MGGRDVLTMGRIGPLLSIAGRGPFCGSTEERANLSHWAIQQFYAEQVIFCFLCTQIAFRWRNLLGLLSDLFGICVLNLTGLVHTA